MTRELAAAKKEYTKQLLAVAVPIIYDEIVRLFQQAKATKSDTPVLVRFQETLRQIPQWSSNRVGLEIEKMTNAAPHFEELIAAIFVTNVRILSAVKLGANKKKFKLDLPTSETFVHDVYVRVAKRVYSRPLLFSEKRYKDLEENRAEVYEMIRDSIEESVRFLLPVKSILDSYLNLDGESSSEDEGEGVESGSGVESAPAPAQPAFLEEPMAVPEQTNPDASQFLEPSEDVKEIPVLPGSVPTQATQTQGSGDAFFDDAS